MKQQTEGTPRNRFSKRHWLVIAAGFVMFYFYNASTSDGMNVIVPRLAQERGWDYAYTLSFATLAGCVSVFGQLLFGLLCRKLGPRKTISIALALAAGFFALYGFAWSIPVYVVALCGVVSCSSAYSYVGVSSLIANWFPEKKGIASGYSSMGTPASTATSVAALTFLFGRVGFTPVMAAVAAVLLALAVLSFLLLRDTPEECGELPDGGASDGNTVPGAAGAAAGGEISVRDMLKIREMWLTGVISGLYSIVTIGVMGQFVIRHAETGISESGVLLMLTVCAVMGIVGSPILGRLENRLGTKRAFQLCCLLYLAAMLLNFTNVRILVYLSVICIGVVITGTPIFLMSFLVSIFGRKNFKTAYAIAYPVSSLIGQTAFLLTAASLRLFGTMRQAYLLFALMLAAILVLTLFLRMDRWKHA